MPPKARITKDMIIEAAFNVVKTSGAEEINVRKIAAELCCSTQPVMYHFRTMEELRAEVFQTSVDYIKSYIFCDDSVSIKELAGRYLRFSKSEKYLFKFIFQSGRLKADLFESTFADENFVRIVNSFMSENGLNEEQARYALSTLYTSVHGFACLFANECTDFDDNNAIETIDKLCGAIVASAK